VLAAAAVCGISFAGVQFLVSNYVGPQLTDILSSLAAVASLIVLFLVWKPKDTFHFKGNEGVAAVARSHPARAVAVAWMPYGLLVVCVLLWGFQPVRTALNGTNLNVPWPGLHNAIERVPPVVPEPAPYAAQYTFGWLSASGTACMAAVLASALFLRMRPRKFAGVVAATARQLFFSLLTIAAVLALAFLMNYSGATATLGLAFAETGRFFPFFSALLGWLGVFLTGSDTSANALFGNLQVITATRLGLSPALMASANSAGGVMGKMISLQSIAVACAAAGLAREDESRLFRFTLRHSVVLAALIGLIVVVYAYVGGGV
jgi:L-lactate permease